MSTPGVGIQITSPTGTGPQGGPEQVIFTTKYPFAKLDTQLGIDTTVNPPKGPVSFQNISIFFNTEPPVNPDGVTIVATQVYQFKHGYNYIPTYWLLYQNNTGNPNTESSWVYGNERSLIIQYDPQSYAALGIKVDETNFTIYVDKVYLGGLGITPPDIIGFTLKLRIYIFTDPVLLK